MAERYTPSPRPPRRRLPCGIIAFFVLLTPVFLCGLALCVYLLFPPAPLNILVLGLDARPGEGFTARTDSIILVSANPARLQLSMMSIPRDLFIDVPGYGLERINTVNVLGEMEAPGRGPALLAESIAANFGVETQRYVRLNFDAFVQLIDAVGGVTIDVERTIIDDAYPTADGGTMRVQFDPGVQPMDGERALQYARTRHADDDYARARRQQQVIAALAGKLINPVNWGRALQVINTTTDSNLSAFDLAATAPAVILSLGRFEQLVIDRDYITSRDGVSVPNYDVIRPWLDTHFR